MKWLSLAAFLLCAIGIVLVLGITPQRISDDATRILHPRMTIKERALLVSGRKKKNRLATDLLHIKEALEASGRRGAFGVVCVVSFAIAAGGVLLWVLFGLWYVFPIALTASFLLPFFIAESTVESYDKRMNEELETALSVISAAYVRGGNFVDAVKESLPNVRPPADRMFSEFLVNATVISPDLTSCIRRMQSSSENRVFRDWCEVLLACVEDSSNRDALMPVVSELTELRLANSEMQTVINECRKEYFGMVILTLCNIPLLCFLNKDWWNTLIHSLPGQIALSICGTAVLITAFFMMKFTKPMDYNNVSGVKK